MKREQSMFIQRLTQLMEEKDFLKMLYDKNEALKVFDSEEKDQLSANSAKEG